MLKEDPEEAEEMVELDKDEDGAVKEEADEDGLVYDGDGVGTDEVRQPQTSDQIQKRKEEKIREEILKKRRKWVKNKFVKMSMSFFY